MAFCLNIFLLVALSCISTTRGESSCPDGSEPVDCLLDPCDPRIVPTCEAFPDAVCKADFCGGCNERFFVGRREVTDMCGGCPDGSQPVNCLVNPCDPSIIAPTCQAFPSAVCKADFCGGCNARFFVGRREVTDMCDRRCPYKGQDFFKCLPCQQSCDGTVTCNVVCQPGCGCPTGKAFDEVRKRCVPPAVCSRTKSAESFGLCPIAGQVFQECRTCPATCEDPDLACPQMYICLEGCGCPSGQLIDEAINSCVNPQQCPKEDAEVY